MAKSIADDLMKRRAALAQEARDLATKAVAEDRDFTAEEQAEFDKRMAEVDALEARANSIVEGEKRAKELEESFQKATGMEGKALAQTSSPGCPRTGLPSSS